MLMTFLQIPPITLPTVAADTTKTISFFDKLSKASDLSFDKFLEQAISSIIHGCIRIAIAVAVFWLGRIILKKLKKVLLHILEKRHVDLSLRTFLASLINITLMFILIIIVIGILGVNTSSFIALFASAGIAIGMALSGTLQNFAGGVMVLLFKPYRVGDYIEAQGQSGTVKEIQIFNTILNTPDNKTIIVPNGGISTGIINNYSKEPRRRVDWVFGIGYNDNYDKAKQIISQLLDSDERIHRTPAYTIAITSLGDSSVNIVVRVWVDSADYWSVYFDMNERVFKEFTKQGINIPFPQMDVHLIPVEK